MVPLLKKQYTKYGSNEGKLFIIELWRDGTNADVKKYVSDHSIPFPVISSGGNGGKPTQIANSYQGWGTPSLVLIAPNHKVIKQNMYHTEVPNILKKHIPSLVKIDNNVLSFHDKDKFNSLISLISIIEDKFLFNVYHQGFYNFSFYKINGSLLGSYERSLNAESCFIIFNDIKITSGYYLLKVESNGISETKKIVIK